MKVVKVNCRMVKGSGIETQPGEDGSRDGLMMVFFWKSDILVFFNLILEVFTLYACILKMMSRVEVHHTGWLDA